MIDCRGAKLLSLLSVSIPAQPIDQLAVCDLSPFDEIPRLREPRPYDLRVLDGLLGMLGIPILVDESVEPGVIELRKEKKVVGRLFLDLDKKDERS